MTARSAEAAQLFRLAAVRWGQAQAKNDYKLANRIHDRALMPALKSAIEIGSEQINKIVDMVDDKDPGVSLWASGFALRHDAARAESALSRLAKRPDLWCGFSAEITLSEWKKGTLEFAWEKPASRRRHTIKRRGRKRPQV